MQDTFFSSCSEGGSALWEYLGMHKLQAMEKLCPMYIKELTLTAII